MADEGAFDQQSTGEIPEKQSWKWLLASGYWYYFVTLRVLKIKELSKFESRLCTK